MAALGAASSAACGGDSAATSMPSLNFGGPSAQTVTSASGQLTIDLRWSPDVPLRGSDAAQLTFLDSAGNPVDGLDLSIGPWMPAHGHGTAVQPVITTTAPGVQVATPLYLFMSGEWQLRMTISGAMDDSAIATVEIP
ncbi:MAG TPA: FixH family protein [Mycobacterium sp.]|nr:FixH family protein [Mycobacterium sp.]